MDTLQIIAARLRRRLLAADNLSETLPLWRLFLTLDKLTMLANYQLQLTDDAVHHVIGEMKSTVPEFFVAFMLFTRNTFCPGPSEDRMVQQLVPALPAFDCSALGCAVLSICCICLVQGSSSKTLQGCQWRLLSLPDLNLGHRNARQTARQMSDRWWRRHFSKWPGNDRAGNFTREPGYWAWMGHYCDCPGCGDLDCTDEEEDDHIAGQSHAQLLRRCYFFH